MCEGIFAGNRSSLSRPLYLLLFLFILAACGPIGKQAALSERELRAELTQCTNIKNPSNFKAISCQGFVHECEKRMKRDGKYRNC